MSHNIICRKTLNIMMKKITTNKLLKKMERKNKKEIIII